MKCPNCGLINPENAQLCDCGYDFSTMISRSPSQKKKKISRISFKIIVVIIGLLCIGFFFNVNRKLDKLTKIVSSIKTADISSIQSDIASINYEISSIQSEISSMEYDISSIDSDVSSIESGISSLELTVSSMEYDISSIVSDVSTMQFDVSSIESDVSYIRIWMK